MRFLPTALLLLTAAAPANLAAVPIGRMDLPWWRHRFEEKQAELARVHPALILLGDSITQNWEKHGPPEWQDFQPVWQRFYGDRRAVNLGFVGDTTASLLWRETHGELDGIAPKVAVILIGANNLGRLHWSAEQTLGGIDADIAELRRRLPATQILLLSVLPSDRSTWTTETTAEINHALAARDWRVTGVTFLDVSHVFMKDGVVDRSMYLDPLLTPPARPLHPTAAAQARLAAAIEPTLARLLGDGSKLRVGTKPAD
jgi:lysophospholipase L1-like esterase